jgi:hypothetical protein
MSCPRPPRARLGFLLVLLCLAAAACAPGYASPAVLYLGWDEAGRHQVFRLDEPEGQPVQLTHADPQRPGDVSDFTLSPDGDAIAYAVV